MKSLYKNKGEWFVTLSFFHWKSNKECRCLFLNYQSIKYFKLVQSFAVHNHLTIGLSQTFQQHCFDSFFSVSLIFQNLYKFKIKGIPLYLSPGFKNINFYFFRIFWEKLFILRIFHSKASQLMKNSQGLRNLQFFTKILKF